MVMINAIANETKERERREKNVVIFGVQASKNSDKTAAKDEDNRIVKAIFKELKVTVDVKNVIKLKSSSD